MNRLNIQQYSKYVLLAIFLAVLTLTIILIKPFLTAVLSSIILAYIFYPVYRKLNRLIKNKTACALITSFLVTVIIALPLLFAANAIVNESVNFYHGIKNIDLADFSAKVSKFLGANIDLNLYVKEILNKISIYIMQGTSNFILSIPQRMVSLFVTVSLMYYLFKEGKSLIEKIKNILPIKMDHKNNLGKRFNNLIYATVYGVIITAIIAGAVGAIGLWIFKVPSPILLGVVMIIVAMLPVVGTWLVWLPAAILKLASGDMFNGIGLLLYGLIIVSTIDNVVRPKVIGSRAQLHPGLVLLGVLGGLYVFGLTGIIIGPMILTTLMVFLESYLSENNEVKS